MDDGPIKIIFLSLGNNLIGTTDDSSGWIGSDLTGTIALPLNPELAALGNYGGPTQTMPLLFGSPAIDAGNNILLPLGITTDQRGSPRVFNGAVDIGAFELQVTIVPRFVVNTTADFSDPSDGTTSLREAIASANALPGHTITFDKTVFASAQTITLAALQLELSSSGTERIKGPAAGVTISGGGRSRVFQVDALVSASISGLTITGGRVGDGIVFVDGLGGGLVNNGVLSLTNCTISGNSVAGNGGGLFNNGTLSLTNCAVGGNESVHGYGGGVFNNYYGTATLTNCSVSGNSANYGSGGGLENSGTATLTNCTVSGNSAFNSGGGLLQRSGTTTLTRCTVSGNEAVYGSGGGVDNFYGTTTLNNCTVTGNSAYWSGGGIETSYGTTTLTNCTVSGNYTDFTGGPYAYGSGGGGVSNSSNSTTNLTKLHRKWQLRRHRWRRPGQLRRHGHAKQLHRQWQLRRQRRWGVLQRVHRLPILLPLRLHSLHGLRHDRAEQLHRQRQLRQRQWRRPRQRFPRHDNGDGHQCQEQLRPRRRRNLQSGHAERRLKYHQQQSSHVEGWRHQHDRWQRDDCWFRHQQQPGRFFVHRAGRRDLQ